MRMWSTICALLLAVAVARAHPSAEYSLDARAQGMGGAFSALAVGPAAIAWNPAGLAWPQPVAQGLFSRAALDPGTSDGPRYEAFAATYHHAAFGVGVAFSRVCAEDAPSSPEDHTLRLGAGIDLGRDLWPRQTWLAMALGLAYKRTAEVAGYSYPVACDGTPAGADVDAGLLIAARIAGEDFRPAPLQPHGDRRAFVRLRTAAVVRNLLKREIVCREPAITRPQVRAIHAGAALEFGTARVSGLGPALAASVAAERETMLIREPHATWTYRRDRNIKRFGGEVGLLGLLAARAGWIQDEDAGIEDWSWGAGAGIPLGNLFGAVGRAGLQLDYARVPQPSGWDPQEHWSATFWCER
jgi:hypothetical protein